MVTQTRNGERFPVKLWFSASVDTFQKVQLWIGGAHTSSSFSSSSVCLIHFLTFLENFYLILSSYNFDIYFLLWI